MNDQVQLQSLRPMRVSVDESSGGPATTTTLENSTQNAALSEGSTLGANGSMGSPSVSQSAQTVSPSDSSSHTSPSSRPTALTDYFLKPIIALLIYALTLYTAYSATSRHSPLGNLSATLGTWLLAVLAKAGDIAFAFAIDDVFDTIAWRKLARRREVSGPGAFGGMGLIWWLSLVSSTGFEALVKIIVGSVRRLRRVWGERGTRIPLREKWRDGKEVRWAVIRLVFLIVLIPGPGIILLADVSQKNVFFPVRSMQVTGGLATYDPEIATTYHTIWGPEIAKLVQSTLRDRSISWQVKPASSDCKRSKTCESYLLAGPYHTVSPWPFTNETNIDAFHLADAPFYQVDLWEPEHLSEVTFSEKKDCTLYGGFDPDNDFSTLVCIADRGSPDVLAAGWYVCQRGYSPENGTCLEPASLPGRFGWQTYLHFHRRRANIVFSRTEFTILEVSKLTEPVSQDVSPASLFQSLDAILYRPNQTTNDFRYDRKSQQYILTQVVGSSLWSSLNKRLLGSAFGRDWVMNMLTMPVYLFQPTILPIDLTIPLTENGTLSQPGLPDENHLTGSYCVADFRSVPGTGTVIAYTCVASVLLLFLWVAKGIAWRWGQVQTSDFGVLDFDVLTVVVDSAAKPNEVNLGDKFSSSGMAFDGRTFLDQVSDLRIGLKR